MIEGMLVRERPGEDCDLNFSVDSQLFFSFSFRLEHRFASAHHRERDRKPKRKSGPNTSPVASERRMRDTPVRII